MVAVAGKSLPVHRAPVESPRPPLSLHRTTPAEMGRRLVKLSSVSVRHNPCVFFVLPRVHERRDDRNPADRSQKLNAPFRRISRTSWAAIPCMGANSSRTRFTFWDILFTGRKVWDAYGDCPPRSKLMVGGASAAVILGSPALRPSVLKPAPAARVPIGIGRGAS